MIGNIMFVNERNIIKFVSEIFIKDFELWGLIWSGNLM